MKIRINRHLETKTDIQHNINLDAISYYNADETGEKILLPYNLDTNTAVALKPLLLTFALVGNPFYTKPCYKGDKAPYQFDWKNDYSQVIGNVDFFLSVNIQKRRCDVIMYARITPTSGKPGMYQILCDTPQTEIQAIAERYISYGNPIPATWLGLVMETQTA